MNKNGKKAFRLTDCQSTNAKVALKAGLISAKPFIWRCPCCGKVLGEKKGK